jgi:hypothetical protein
LTGHTLKVLLLPTCGLAKLGLDNLSFNILSLSALVRADTTSPGINQTSTFNYKPACRQAGSADVRADIFQIPNFAKPQTL